MAGETLAFLHRHNRLVMLVVVSLPLFWLV